MPTSDARIQANRRNASRSTGPKTVAGKETSRQNAVKHGLSGAGVVMPVETAAEVQWRFEAFRAELQPTGTLGLTMLHRAATLAVRMEKCSERESTGSTERVIRAMTEFEAPEGVDAQEVTRLRAEAGRVAAFDSSKEACLARRYEAAAERGFFRALKEYFAIEKQAKTAEPAGKVETLAEVLGSFREKTRLDEEFNAACSEVARPSPRNRHESVMTAPIAPSPRGC